MMNRTDASVSLLLTGADQAERPLELESGQLVPVPVTGRVTASFASGSEVRRYRLDANSAYHIVQRNGRLDIAAVPLVAGPGASPEPLGDGRLLPRPKPIVVPVKLLVDDDEPAVRAIWEPRLRNRLAEASRIFEQHCGVRLEVAAVDMWYSNNRTRDFGQALAEFERAVDPAPGKLAIGFTSQYHIPPRRVPLGGTRGPLHPWILIREWSQHVTASERLEILVHELGHFFGAVHSAETDSVMRPELGDRQSHARAFRIGFDPLNTIAMYLLVDEFRRGRFRGYEYVRPHTWNALHQVYSTLAESLPDDYAAPRYIELLERSRPAQPEAVQ
ncbi:MAG: M12 family metallo-peptidase [Thermoguttaceae bacterium]|jgi:hypothetical protein|nr:M12 family metallo-peptidase [Thermoguttaceae bacterium]